MNRLYTTARRLRLLLVAIAALGLLALPSAASAKRHDRAPRDRNHDGIPDKWEKRHHISTKKRGMGKADHDKDGLNNRAEWRSRTNPRRADSDRDGIGDANEDRDRDDVDNGNEARERTHPCRRDSDRDGIKDGDEDADRDDLDNAGEDESGNDPINPDSDGDGIKDGDESAGKIVSFEGSTLTIRLFGGAIVSGTVDEATYIDCGDVSDDVDEGGEDGDYYGEDGFGDEDEWVDGEVAEKRNGDEEDDSGDADDSADDESDESADDDWDESGDDEGDDSGDDDADEDGADDGADGCGVEALTVDRIVTEASFSATSEGTFFDTIELAR
jgi:hypothetical protein